MLLVLIWLVGGSIGGPYFGKIDEVSTNDQSSFLPSSAEATQRAASAASEGVAGASGPGMGALTPPDATRPGRPRRG